MFDESDGTEIDDGECLPAYEKGAVFILGRHWMPGIATEEFTQETDTIDEVAQRKVHQAYEFKQETEETDRMEEVDQGFKFKPKTDEINPMGEEYQGYEFEQETDKTDTTGDIDQGPDESKLEMPSDAACEYHKQLS